MPCPPPMHMVISAYLPPVRRSSYSALTARMVPVAAIGCPRETPLPFGLVRSGGRPSSRMTASACAAKASFTFEQVDVIDLEARAVEHLPHRGHRAHAHDPWLDPGVAVGDEPPERALPVVLGELRAG